jgi:hypothetical protein
MWEPRRLTTLWASTACCRDIFTLSLTSPDQRILSILYDTLLLLLPSLLLMTMIMEVPPSFHRHSPNYIVILFWYNCCWLLDWSRIGSLNHERYGLWQFPKGKSTFFPSPRPYWGISRETTVPSINEEFSWFDSESCRSLIIHWYGLYFALFIIIWFVRLLALRPLLAYCASLGWLWRWLWRSRWNVDWQGKPKFSEKACPSATFVHHKIPHDQTRVWTRAAAAVGSRRLTAWAMARPYISPYTVFHIYRDEFL